MTRLRKKRATRNSTPTQHAEYGIVKWFNTKGIYDEDIIKECLGYFCKKENKPELIQKNVLPMIMYCQSKFADFARFSSNYIKENNYV